MGKYNTTTNEGMKAFCKVANSRKDWNIREWEKSDPEGLLILKNMGKEIYDNLYNEFYKGVPSNHSSWDIKAIYDPSLDKK